MQITKKENILVLRPQEGAQKQFLSTEADIVLYGGQAGSGKALAIDTPILTTEGFKTMGELKSGDYVFGSDGKPTMITYAFDPYIAKNVYKLIFDTGASIISDAEHLWHTWTIEERESLHRISAEFRENRPLIGTGKRPDLALRNQENAKKYQPNIPMGKIRTTQDIVNTLINYKGKINHTIDLPAPLDNNNKWECEIDPYLLGCWLGDGTSSTGCITSSNQEIIDIISQHNIIIKQPSNKYTYRVQNLTTRLKKYNFLNNKYIPDWIMLVSVSDRLSVLQGLMDTDGYISIDGRIEFCVTNEVLAYGVYRLIVSLGIKSFINKSDAKLYGRKISDRYRIYFTSELPIFKLSRKLLKHNKDIRITQKKLYITKAIIEKPQMVRCISVGNIDKLYLAGHNLIPTHNSFALLLDPLRWIDYKKFTGLILRRNITEIKSTGGLWAESQHIYRPMCGKPNKQELTWTFKSGANIKLSHLENEDTIYKYQGAQICYLAFDELTHFSQDQFFYMISRNRSVSGIKPYVKCTTNPDKDSWVRKFIDWWIDPDTGKAIPERSGIIRYFMRYDRLIIWGDTRDEVLDYYREHISPNVRDDMPVKSFTFIPAKLEDNQILLKKDPSYEANLLLQNKVEMERLRMGNWNISYSDMGTVLNRNDFSRYNLDDKLKLMGYFIELYFVVDGASRTKEANDYSVVGLFARARNEPGNFYILDWLRIKLEEPDLEQRIIEKWNHWRFLSPRCIYIERGACGISLLQRLPRKGIPVSELEPTKDKYLRLNDGLNIIKNGFVHIPDNAVWVEKFFEECEGFRADMKHVLMDGDVVPHDDQVDVLAYGISTQVTGKGFVSVANMPEKKKQNMLPIWMRD